MPTRIQELLNEVLKGREPWCLLTGHVLDMLRAMPDASTHVVVTSPPYWGLRDYKTEPILWPGKTDCGHAWDIVDPIQRDRQHLKEFGQRFGSGGGNKHSTGSQYGDSSGHEFELIETVRKGSSNGRVEMNSTLESAGSPKTIGVGADSDVGETKQYRSDRSRWCRNCGAWEGHLGLEPTPEMFIEHLVLIFREVHRVLRRDGTLWVVIGDSYYGSWGNYSPGGQGGQRDKTTERWSRRAYSDKADWRPPTSFPHPQIKPKDLVCIPWRLGLALQADGWYLRSAVIWNKPNGLPGSQTDRPTLNYEHVLLLAKSERYYYDDVAVRERSLSAGRASGNKKRRLSDGSRSRINTHMGESIPWRDNGKGRTLRAVWKIATSPYKGTHFATFPTKLVERPIKAGTSERGCCPDCGSPWLRVIRKPVARPVDYEGKNLATDKNASARRILANVRARRSEGGAHENPFPEPETVGWRPDCPCYNLPPWPTLPKRPKPEAPVSEWETWESACAPIHSVQAEILRSAKSLRTVPCVVLDPFAGSGTTLAVATRLSRCAVGVELNTDYVDLAVERIRIEGGWPTQMSLWASHEVSA